MAFGNPDFTSLSPYTQENTDLIATSILNTKDLSYVSVRSGVAAGTTTLNLFSSDFGDVARDCAWSDTGVSTFDQIPVTVGDRKIQQSLCGTDARQYWLAERMNPSAYGDEEMPFAEVIANYMLAGVSKNMADFIGSEIATQVSAAATPYAGAAILDVSNALEQLNDLYDSLDERVKMMDDVKIWMSPANYRTVVRAIVAQNGAGFFHYNVGDGQGEVYLPGTNALIVKSSGLVGSNTIVAAPTTYCVLAVGLLDDQDRLNLNYDSSEDVIKMSAYYRRGLAVYSADQCATNGL